MPAITVQSIELTQKQKEILAKEYATLFSKVTNVPLDRIYVFFNGYSLDNVAKGDELFSKNPPYGRIKGKFNEGEHEY